jgi:hemerythrin-like domain-containing protein
MDRPDVTMMYVVHEAFRRDLARMQAAAAQAHKPAMHKALHDCWATFNQYLSVHHTAEDEMLWPPMRDRLSGRDLALLGEMVDEHSRLDPLLHDIDNALRQAVPARLTDLFADLADVLLGHFDHEETAALPLVQQTLSAHEWNAFGDDQRRRIGWRGAGWFFPWLLDDASADVQDSVLALVPPPVRLVYRLIWEPQYRRRSPWRAE